MQRANLRVAGRMVWEMSLSRETTTNLNDDKPLTFALSSIMCIFTMNVNVDANVNMDANMDIYTLMCNSHNKDLNFLFNVIQFVSRTIRLNDHNWYSNYSLL